LAVVGLVGALLVALRRGFTGGAKAFLPALPLLAFATIRFDEHTKWALLLALAEVALLASWPRLGGRLRRRPIPA
jgi:uncharacterized membrane protein YhhN